MRHSVDLVDRIRDDQWDRPTPCAQWNLRQLVQHMTSENRGFAAAAGGEKADRTPWTFHPVDPDLRVDFARSADQVVAAFGADGVLDGTFWLPLIHETRQFPARQAVSFHLLDYVVHGWDVAAATGQPVAVEDDLVAAVLEIAEREVPDTERRLNPRSSFKPGIQVRAAAPAHDRLLAWLGRSPRWPVE